MKAVKRMVVANVAILVDKEDPRQCGDEPEIEGKRCRFIDGEGETCLLFNQRLKFIKKDPDGNFMRVKKCLDAEPNP